MGSISESDRWQRFKNSTADSWGDQVDSGLLFWQEGLLVFTAQWTVRRKRAPSISKRECFCYLIWHSVCTHNVSREQGASIWINMETGGRGGRAEQPKRWLQKQVHRSRRAALRGTLPQHGDVQETPFQTTVLLPSNGSKLLLISTHAYHLAGAKQQCVEWTQACPELKPNNPHPNHKVRVIW